MDRPHPPSPARALFALGLYFAAALVLGSILAVLVQRGVDPGDDRTATRLARRVLMLSAALLLPLLLPRLGFRGRRDLGWSGEGAPRPTRLFLTGLAWGLASLAFMLAVSLWAGTREWALVHSPLRTALKGISYLGGALVVGVGEETLARGLLFFPLWRALGAPGAALATGTLFAWAHFLAPDPAALRHPEFWSAVGGTLSSALGQLTQEPFGAARFANLLLMSLVLCAAVARTGSIWAAAGLHAGWVWIKRMAAIVSDSREDHALRAWVGCRTDFTDSWACALLLGLMLAALVLRPAPARPPASPG